MTSSNGWIVTLADTPTSSRRPGRARWRHTGPGAGPARRARPPPLAGQGVLDLVTKAANVVERPHSLGVQVGLAHEGLAIGPDIAEGDDHVRQVHAVEPFPPVGAAGVDRRVQL